MLQSHQFVRRRRNLEQLASCCGQNRFVGRFQIELRDAREFCDSRIQRRHVSDIAD